MSRLDKSDFLEALGAFRKLKEYGIRGACINAEGPNEKEKMFEPGIMNSVPEELRKRKFKISDLSVREDKESGRICIFTVESQKIKEREYRYTLTNINSQDKKIEYIFKVFPSGLFGYYEYRKLDDKIRYGKEFNIYCLQMQLFGEEFEEEKEFTIEELIELQNQINNKKDKAKYDSVIQIKYLDSYQGQRLLENLRIAVKDNSTSPYSRITSREYICLDDKNLKIYRDINSNLCVVNKETGDKEITSYFKFWEEYVLYGGDIAICGMLQCSLDGFTPEAFKKIIETKQKEKEKDDYEIG